VFDPPPTRAHSDSRIEGQRGWVVEMSGRGAGCAHPLEKSAPIFEVQAYTAYYVSRQIVWVSALRLSKRSSLRFS
jgi:hypothetical protein